MIERCKIFSCWFRTGHRGPAFTVGVTRDSPTTTIHCIGALSLTRHSLDGYTWWAVAPYVTEQCACVRIDEPNREREAGSPTSLSLHLRLNNLAQSLWISRRGRARDQPDIRCPRVCIVVRL